VISLTDNLECKKGQGLVLVECSKINKLNQLLSCACGVFDKETVVIDVKTNDNIRTRFAVVAQ
jgi:hypothetical protein